MASCLSYILETTLFGKHAPERALKAAANISAILTDATASLMYGSFSGETNSISADKVKLGVKREEKQYLEDVSIQAPSGDSRVSMPKNISKGFSTTSALSDSDYVDTMIATLEKNVYDAVAESNDTISSLHLSMSSTKVALSFLSLVCR